MIQKYTLNQIFQIYLFRCFRAAPFPPADGKPVDIRPKRIRSLTAGIQKNTVFCCMFLWLVISFFNRRCGRYKERVGQHDTLAYHI